MYQVQRDSFARVQLINVWKTVAGPSQTPAGRPRFCQYRLPMTDPRGSAAWALAEATRIRDWQVRAAARIQSDVRDLQDKLREAGESKLRAIGSILAQRASLRISIEEHDVRTHVADDESSLASLRAEYAELLDRLVAKQIRPFSADRLTRWSRLADLGELEKVDFKRPPTVLDENMLTATDRERRGSPHPEPSPDSLRPSRFSLSGDCSCAPQARAPQRHAPIP